MNYKQLGGTGIRVSELCLGAMNFGNPTSEDEAVRIIDRFLDAGGNFIDTANVYNRGISEEIVGRAIKGRREEIVLATKVHFPMGDGPNEHGNSRKHIMQQIEQSLKRLQTDYIDIYYIHRPDPTTPIEETLDTLNDLVHKGYVRYIGSSTFPVWQLVEAQWISDKRNYVRFVVEQPPYSIIERQIEARLIPYAKKYGVALVTWSPLAGGWLTGKYLKGIPEDSRAARRPEWKDMQPDTPLGKKRIEAVGKIMEVIREGGYDPVPFAVAWVLKNPYVTAPIIGPRTLEQLETYLKALEVEIPDDVMKKIDEIVPPGTSLWQAENKDFVV